MARWLRQIKNSLSLLSRWKRFGVRVNAVLFIATLISLSTAGAEPDASGTQTVRFVRDRDAIFLDCQDIADSLKWEFKVVKPGRLATFCREGDQGVCIPVILNAENHLAVNRVAIRSDVFGKALGFQIRDLGDAIEIEIGKPLGDTNDHADVPAYNADWGPGRGFSTGQTLPDIPLVDLEGNEVRFGQYLGKRYILYCWASW